MQPKPTDPNRADLLIDHSLTLLAPVVRLLMAGGVTYPQFAAALKLAFLRAAHAEIAAEGRRTTDSALSLRSGVPRRDVRALVTSGALPTRTPDRSESLPDEVFMRWTNDPRFLDADGMPRVLPLASRDADEPSFEMLAQSVSSDHPSTAVLDELVRLGLAEASGGTVRLLAASFVPRRDFAEALAFMSAAAGDHLAAAVANVQAIAHDRTPAFLEQSLYADELSRESIDQLHRLARRIWESALRRMFALASERSQLDQNNALVEQALRMRFGVYFYAEPAKPVTPAAELAVSTTKDLP